MQIIEKKKDSPTIFGDSKLAGMKDVLKLKPFPMVVLNTSVEVAGVLDESSFWKALSLYGWESKVGHATNSNVNILQREEELNVMLPNTFDYFILTYENGYKIFSPWEVYDLRYKNMIQLNTTLQEELDLQSCQNKSLKQILNSSYDEIYVTDADGITLFVSESCKKFTGLSPETFLDKNVKELVKKGIISISVSVKVMETLQTESAQQVYSNGKTAMATATPIFDDKGKLHRIITNTRDVTELEELRHKLAYTKSLMDHQFKHLKLDHMAAFFNKLVTRSDKMLPIIEIVEKVATTDSSILIEGESGVGKGVLTRIIHDLSSRKDKSFVIVNCGAIPASLIEAELFGYEGGSFTGASKHGKIGLVEQANGGTLFLDEIGELPLELQVKILHLVQEKSIKPVGGSKHRDVDIRIISATNKNLKEMIKDNLFREDLYYRLHVVPLYIPALRERREDIPLLVDHFLTKFNKKHTQSIGFAESSLLMLQSYEWPGNVRELENLIEQLVVTSNKSTIFPIDLPAHLKNHSEGKKLTAEVMVSGIMPLKKAVEEIEKKILSSALQKFKTSRKIASELKVNQTTVIRKLQKYKLKALDDINDDA